MPRKPAPKGGGGPSPLLLPAGPIPPSDIPSSAAWRVPPFPHPPSSAQRVPLPFGMSSFASRRSPFCQPMCPLPPLIVSLPPPSALSISAHHVLCRCLACPLLPSPPFLRPVSSLAARHFLFLLSTCPLLPTDVPSAATHRVSVAPQRALYLRSSCPLPLPGVPPSVPCRKGLTKSCHKAYNKVTNIYKEKCA